MPTRVIATIALSATLVAAPHLCAQQPPDPPMATIIPRRLEAHDHVRIDNYYWLNERENPDVIEYLEAENAYTEAMMEHLEPMQEALFEEIKGRIKENDESVPYRLDEYFYYNRFEEGQEYPIYGRKRGSLEAAEEILLDVNELAEGHEFYQVRSVEPSFNHSLLAFAVDDVGRRIYTIRFKDLQTGEMLHDTIPEVTGNLAWANDNLTVFYTKQDPQTLRWHRIYRHVLGTDVTGDVLVYEEEDPTFNSVVFKTRSRAYIMIASFQTLSSEYRFLDANDPVGEFRVMQPRERDHEYSVGHLGDHFYIRTNDSARNFRLMRTLVTRTAKEFWEEVIPHRDDVLLQEFEVFSDHLVLSERHEGLTNIRIIRWDGTDDHYLDFGEPTYRASLSMNPNLDTPLLRYSYSSMTTPNSVFDYEMVSRERVLLKQDEVVGSFSSDDYVTERLHATSPDGVPVPISLVYRRGFEADGSAPLLLYGYGSYGFSMEASFSSARLSLLDRGFVFAIAHVRGGQEMGRYWYEDGKLLNKRNTFTDFIASAEHLSNEGYADPERVYAMGASAGGLLMGAVTNMRPDLFHGVAVRVPFVDVVTTMLDETIPLTTSEYDEWGNPNDPEYYDYILSYSPYDNVEAKGYPNLLVTTGLYDSQVQYWEPAKWVAKLRALKTDTNRLLLHTNMEAGHGGASGRFRRYRETAMIYAFLLDLAGLATAPMQ